MKGERRCATDGCKNSVSGRSLYCPKCKKEHIRATRLKFDRKPKKCDTEGCPNMTSGKSMYCESCKKARQKARSDEQGKKGRMKVEQIEDWLFSPPMKECESMHVIAPLNESARAAGLSYGQKYKPAVTVTIGGKEWR